MGTNPYGIGIPSPVPRPRVKPRGEVVPLPRLPREYPWYLKPIPVNIRDIGALMRAYLNRREPQLQRLLYSTWNAQRDAIKYQEIRNAIRDGQIPEAWFKAHRVEYAKFINERMAPEWRKAWATGQAHLAKGAIIDLSQLLLTASEYSRLWIEERGSELAVNLLTGQHEALRALLHRHIQTGGSVRELAINMRGVIGLTFREEKQYQLARLAWAQAGKTQAQIEHLAGNYWGYLHRRRAERIARTELAYAYNYGQYDLVKQGDAQGLFGGAIEKVWLTAADERTCEFCGPLDGSVVGLEQTYPGATQKVPEVYTCPAHPLCRCTITYRVIRDARF